MMKAEKMLSGKYASQLYIQILNNRGVLYVCQRNYQEADYYQTGDCGGLTNKENEYGDSGTGLLYLIVLICVNSSEDMKRGVFEKNIEEYRDLLIWGRRKLFRLPQY